MGQCGCGDFYSEKTFDLGGGLTLSLDRHSGCGECATPIGVRLSVMDKQGAAAWLYDDQYPPKESLVPGPGDYGIKEHWVGLLDQRSLVEAAESLERSEAPMDGYTCLADWLRDHGLTMLQVAMHLYHNRMERERKEREARRQGGG